MSARLLTRLRRKARRQGGERGLTLIEVLVAFLLLFIVTLAVLQLLAMAYLSNQGSMIRTELTYKAEQVVETIRLLNFRYYSLGASATAAETQCCPINAGSSMTISTSASDSTCQTFWGPGGANVLNSDSRFTLNYAIDANLGVTVNAVPQTTGPNQYLGPSASKVVIYVAQLRDW